MKSEKFEIALAENRQMIFDGLSHPNPYARTQTLGLLMEYEAFDDEFVRAVIPLLADDETTMFGLSIKDVARDYLLAASV